MGGDVAGRDQLIARTPEEHRRNGIDLRMRTEVDGDRRRRRPGARRDLDSGAESWTAYDKLVIATGARPDAPAAARHRRARACTACRPSTTAQALLDDLDATAGRRRRWWSARGYIGVEMAEALHQPRATR